MSDEPDGRTIPAAGHEIHDTQERAKGRVESWQADPSERSVSNAINERHVYKRTDRRTGLRQTDDHASWRQVYRHCHVGVGIDG
jgi:hypothetical protein